MSVWLKIKLVIAVCLTGITTFGQHTLTVVVDEFPQLKETDTIYIAGDFNRWNPGGLALVKEDKVWKIPVKLEGEKAEFKFTAGSWEKVETNINGGDRPNREFTIKSDTTVYLSISRFKSESDTVVARKHTLSPRVRVMDTAFSMPQLKTKRRIWVYLPRSYKTRITKRYPVLYMHDGQNLFDDAITSFGEWGVDEALDTLQKKHGEAIVVAIDNGPRRLNEYNPFDNERFGQGDGDLYLSFIVDSLMPYVNKKYRTAKGRTNTMIAGSSMGGLISYYAMIKHPEKFGKAGVFSPAFWTAKPGIDSITKEVGSSLRGKMFFYMGGKEGDDYMNDMMEIQDEIGKNSSLLILSITDEESKHNETAWRKWFPAFYKWIMRNDLNYIVPTDYEE